MANVSRVNGFRPLKYLNGAPWNGAATRYYVDAADGTALFVGDLVKLSGAGTTTYGGIRSVVQATAGAAVVGAVVGIAPDFSNLNAAPYRVASTNRYVFVADDPNLLFEAQEDGDTTPIAMASTGLNADFIVGSGSTSTGQSGMQIDSSTVAATATLPLKLMEPVQRANNELTTSGQAYTRWVVKLNNHQLGSSTGTAGV